MSLTLCYESASFSQGAHLSDLLDRLTNLQVVAETAAIWGDTLYKCDEIYDVPFADSQELADWMYDTRAGSHVGERKLLMQLIDRAPTFESAQYGQFCEDMLSTPPPLHVGLVVLLPPMPQKDLHIHKLRDLTRTHRMYLVTVPDIDSFLVEAEWCFSNLYFHERVSQTMKQLSAPFEKYKVEIIRHLSALNDDFTALFEEHERKNLPAVLEIFESATEVSASMEGKKKSAKKRLTFEFLNDEGHVVQIVCEPHTKLEGTGNAGDTKYRFDRIYFNQGQSDIEEGKVLIAHIGKHL